MPQKRLLSRSLAVLLLVGAIEATAAVSTRLMVRWGWMAWIPTASKERIDYYIVNHNPTLGWGPVLNAQGKVLRLDPRSDPAVDDRAPACASAYGDSFTAGSEVDDDGAYPHYLGLRLRCRVANYGIGGYGTDQALMLFRAQEGLDTAPVAVLGHVTEDLMRNVNQYRDLLYPGDDQELNFKPSFTVHDGALQFVPNPVESEADFEGFERNPDAFLQLDAFRSRPRRAFPYSFALARWALTDFHARAHLAGIPRYASFYSPDHPSHALALTVAILHAFADEARRRGQQPFVLLIPLGRDLLYYRKTHTWVDQPLADALGRIGVRVIHAGPLMSARLGSADPCSLFRDCYRHFNARGYEMLADVASEAIAKERVVAR